MKLTDERVAVIESEFSNMTTGGYRKYFVDELLAERKEREEKIERLKAHFSEDAVLKKCDQLAIQNRMLAKQNTELRLLFEGLSDAEMFDTIKAERDEAQTHANISESANAALREEIERNINEEPTDHLSCKEVCAEHPDDYDTEQICPYCDGTFCPHCDPCLTRALAELSAAREKSERLRIQFLSAEQIDEDARMDANEATTRAEAVTAKLGKVRKLDRYGTCGRPPPYLPKMVKRSDGEYIRESDVAAILDAGKDEP